MSSIIPPVERTPSSAVKEKAKSQEKELEILASDIETRLRNAIFRIIRPALDQLKDYSDKVDQLESKLEAHDEMILVAEKLREEVGILRDMNNVLGEEMRRRDSNLTTFERNTRSELADIRFKETETEKKLEDQQVDLRKCAVEDQRMWDEAERLQKQHDEFQKAMSQADSVNKQQAAKAHEEIMDQVRTLMKQREELLEDLFGEDKGLVKLEHQVNGITRFIQPLPNIELNVSKVMQHNEQLDTKQDDCVEVCKQMSETMANFDKSVNSRLTNMNDEFKRSKDALVAHHASLMRDIRQRFEKEIGAARQVREEILEFENTSKESLRSLTDMIESEGRRTDVLHRELTSEIDVLNKALKKERLDVETDFRYVRHEIEGNQALLQNQRTSVEFLSRIMGLIMEGEKVASAIHIQDFTDRQGEHWLGALHDLGKKPQPAQTADALEQQARASRKSRRPDNGSIGGSEKESIVHLDWRKGVARLEYMPGQVPYNGILYDKRDILLLHHKLLQRAHAAFEKGPPRDAPAPRQRLLIPGSRDTVAVQPGANGGISASIEAVAVGASFNAAAQSSLKAAVLGGEGQDADSEDRKSSVASHQTGRGSSSSNMVTSRLSGGDKRPGTGGDKRPGTGGGQRPGSQGQPGAIGSRGSIMGTLGETEPGFGQSIFGLAGGGVGLGSGANGMTPPGKATPPSSGLSPPLRLPAIEQIAAIGPKATTNRKSLTAR